mmetsp:Transcript_30304/g.65001  ORF Transcript_30304/g.65001 Transcript_30304/m.65001 type:complete len:203 (+) Transcript_30304:817-1425(+)
MDNDDVLEAKIVSCLQSSPSVVYKASFRSMFSTTASTIKSTSRNALASVVNSIFPRASSAISRVIFSFSTSLSTDFKIRSRLDKQEHIGKRSRVSQRRMQQHPKQRRKIPFPLTTAKHTHRHVLFANAKTVFFAVTDGRETRQQRNAMQRTQSPENVVLVRMPRPWNGFPMWRLPGKSRGPSDPNQRSRPGRIRIRPRMVTP